MPKLDADFKTYSLGKRWGFTPQRPIKRAYEQRPEAIQKWLKEDFPPIAQRAKDEDAEIHWGDATAVVNTDVRGRGYPPKGQTPVAYAVGGQRLQARTKARLKQATEDHMHMLASKPERVKSYFQDPELNMRLENQMLIAG